MTDVYLNRLISALYRRNQSYLCKQFKELDLPLDVGQCPAMMQVFRQPGISQEGISSGTGLDKGTIARAIRQLEENGMVVRENDDKDKRMYRIYPTSKALESKHELFDILAQLHQILYQDCSDREIQSVHQVLLKMLGNVEKTLQSE